MIPESEDISAIREAFFIHLDAKARWLCCLKDIQRQGEVTELVVTHIFELSGHPMAKFGWGRRYYADNIDDYVIETNIGLPPGLAAKELENYRCAANDGNEFDVARMNEDPARTPTMKPEAKPSIAGHITGTVALWALSLYVFFSGDPTHIIVSDRFSQALNRPTDVALKFLYLGAFVLCVGLRLRKPWLWQIWVAIVITFAVALGVIAATTAKS